MMKRFVVLEKKVGETPLACLLSYKKAHPELGGIPASYAGRLDPMASGKLLILLGEECKKVWRRRSRSKNSAKHSEKNAAGMRAPIRSFPQNRSKGSRFSYIHSKGR